MTILCYCSVKIPHLKLFPILPWVAHLRFTFTNLWHVTKTRHYRDLLLGTVLASPISKPSAKQITRKEDPDCTNVPTLGDAGILEKHKEFDTDHELKNACSIYEMW